MASLTASALGGIPDVRAGDDLAELIVSALAGTELEDGQLVAIAHKAVSKAEGAVVSLAAVRPGARARELASGALATPSAVAAPRVFNAPRGLDASGAPAADRAEERDPRFVQVVLDESAEILRAERGVLICRTRHGFVCANAGVDASNAGAPSELVLLPRDPDASARRIRARLRELTGASVAVLISDSFGRAWRHGQLDTAIGLAGMRPLDDWRGRSDATGLELRATWLAVADAAAACADLARAKDSREPVVLLGGLERFVTTDDGPGAAMLLRAPEEDLFR